MDPQGTEWPFSYKKLLIRSELIETTVEEKSFRQEHSWPGAASQGAGCLPSREEASIATWGLGMVLQA